jgi:hypothetical protein
MLFNYDKICQDLIKDLPSRQKEVVSRRFGLKTGQRETLEAIGKDYGITRERVRQIEEDGFLKLKQLPSKECQKVFQYFAAQLKTSGDLKREDILLQDLGGKRFQPQAYFLLTLGSNFERVGESEELHSLWTIDQNSLVLAKKVIDSFYNKLKRINRPLSLKAYNSPVSLNQQALVSYLEISKKIQKGADNLFGLKDWPEINPRGVKDKAYLVFKKTKKPLHFSEVAELIDKSLGREFPLRQELSNPKPQTVHNELIRDERFILVGRGIYALREWGYEPGQVKDVILKVLKRAGRPLSKEEILKKVSEQRLVKENTVLLNLSNKKYFLKASKGYIVRRA